MIRPARKSDFPLMQILLQNAGLPAEDLEESTGRFYLAATESDQRNSVIAMGGYEKYGEDLVLLRSFVTLPEYRGLGIGRKILDHVSGELRQAGVRHQYLLTTDAADWFAKAGFRVISREEAPAEIRNTRQFRELCPTSSKLLYRSAKERRPRVPEADRSELFDAGYYCAEAALIKIAEHLEIESPLIPSIATGFCSGMSRTAGMCGALTGGILGLNLAYGRDRELETVDQNYAAVQQLIKEYEEKCGSTRCSELLGCHLGTLEGQQYYRDNNLGERCTRYTAISTELAIKLSDPANLKKR